jgi:hypothetical protein
MHSHSTTAIRSSRPVRRALAVAAVVGALLAACSSDKQAAPTTTEVTTTTRKIVPSTTTTTTTPETTTTSTIPETTTAVAETTTTAVPDTSTTTSVEETTTTAPAAPVYAITGLPATDPGIAARQTLVVKIDNSAPARPQSGLNEADMVFEEIVNDSLTRFALIYQSLGDNVVGPCRSGRIQDIDLMGMFNHPLFAWSGGNATVTAAIRASDLVDIGPSRAAVYYRIKDRKAPHNLYSSTDALRTQTTPNAAGPPQIWQFRPDGVAVQGSATDGVDVRLDSVDASWRWDASKGLYLRQTDGHGHDDALSGQVSTNNVVVLPMDYVPGISDSPDAQTIGHGDAFVFTGGNYVHGTWSRDDRLAPFTLTADDGTPILLSPGRTFVELPRNGTAAVTAIPAT